MSDARTVKRTDVYMVEYDMPCGLSPKRVYSSVKPFFRDGEGVKRTFVGYVAGKYGEDDFVLGALLDMAIEGTAGMSWHPAVPMGGEDVLQSFVIISSA